MKRCIGNNTQEWGADSIYDIECPNCGKLVEFFKDEIKRRCQNCQKSVLNDRKDFDCGQHCSSSSIHERNFCSKYKRSKDQFNGHRIA